MKTLIYKDKQFYLCDDIENTKGQTCVVSNYEPSPTNMPHKEFNKEKGTNIVKGKEKDKDKGKGKDTDTSTNNNIIIYARPSCPYCIDFVDFLKKNNKNTQFYDNLIYVEVDSESPKNIFSKKNILQNLSEEIGDHSTVPIVFYKGKFIGGADKSKQLLEKAAPKSRI